MTVSASKAALRCTPLRAAAAEREGDSVRRLPSAAEAQAKAPV